LPLDPSKGRAFAIQSLSGWGLGPFGPSGSRAEPWPSFFSKLLDRFQADCAARNRSKRTQAGFPACAPSIPSDLSKLRVVRRLRLCRPARSSSHRNHQVLIRRTRPHHIRLGRIGIRRPRITYHRLHSRTHDHHVRAGLELRVRLLGRVMMYPILAPVTVARAEGRPLAETHRCGSQAG